MRRFWIFWIILATLTAYTGLKLAELRPDHAWLGAGGGIAFVAFIVGWQFAYRAGFPPEDTLAFRALAWTATVGMGLWSIFVFFSLSFDLGESVAHFVFGRPEAAAWTSGALLLASIVVTALGVRDAIAGPYVKEVEVAIPGLPSALEGTRIAQISDLHIGATVRRGYVERVVSIVERLSPDLVAVTGDVADGKVSKLREQLSPLSRLKAPMGVYYVTGNHEYYWGAPAWIEEVRRLGLVPLVNEHRVVEKGGARVLVAGVPDDAGGHFVDGHDPDAKRAAAPGVARELSVLLAHRPSAFADAERAGFDLQLSGHTHGGQFFPWSLLIPLFHRYYKGLNRHGKLWVYVNSGTAYWGPPLRFAVPSEITLLKLKRAA